jgi:hypothetical protein
MQTSNGRATNMVKHLRSRHSKDRKSPYGEKPIMHKKIMASTSLPEDKIDRCIGAIKLALSRSNREEAVAAIDRAFLVDKANPITGNSHLEELRLRDAVIDKLNAHHIYRICDVLLLTEEFLRNLSGFEEHELDTLILALESQGFRLSDAGDVD